MERYCKYKYVTNADGLDGVVRVLCVWKEEEMEASYVVMNHNWVGVSFRRLTDNKVFVVYLPPRFGERLQSFSHLEALVSRVDGPLLIIGDFNAMLSSCNKSGSAPLPASCISFSRFIYACRLKEVKDSNKKFTWSNHRQRQDSVQCKLDWCLVNNEWQIAFGGEGSLKVQTSASSDYSVLLYQIRDTIDDTQALVDEQGRQEGDARCLESEVRGCPMMRLLVTLNRLRRALLVWNTNSFGNLSNNIANLQSRLEGCRERVEQGIEGVIGEEHRVREQLSQALLMEEVMWKQKSRIRWFAKGDKNTHFFHAMAKSRQTKRKITSLECEGTKYVQSGQIHEVCTTYFRNVLATDVAQGRSFEDVDRIPKVTDDDNEQLLKPILEEEVTAAMWSLDKDSAAGPDGFPNYFYQECWTMVNTDVVKAVQDFFTSGKIVRSVNETMICLIPKKENSKKVEDFRPISLCNSIYKIITKVIVNRMRDILGRIINANQAAFLKGRHIHDNILWVNETINSKEFWDKGGCCLKLDLMKAYDRVSWAFLANSMKFLGFHAK
ncbi:Transposon TX1 uncharacterized protein [Nymphaea thermarum]|nr:Transposon TX1 uncharacterized protein [Nymphaea thermarum]